MARASSVPLPATVIEALPMPRLSLLSDEVALPLTETLWEKLLCWAMAPIRPSSPKLTGRGAADELNRPRAEVLPALLAARSTLWARRLARPIAVASIWLRSAPAVRAMSLMPKTSELPAPPTPLRLTLAMPSLAMARSFRSAVALALMSPWTAPACRLEKPGAV